MPKKRPIHRRRRGRRRPDKAAPKGYISKRELLAQRDALVARAEALIVAAREAGDDELVVAAEAMVQATASHAAELPATVIIAALRLASSVNAPAA